MNSKSRKRTKQKYNLYSMKGGRTILENATIAAIAKYLNYKSYSSVRGYVLMDKKDLRHQVTGEMFYYEPVLKNE